jgi:hypothetical protein
MHLDLLLIYAVFALLFLSVVVKFLLDVVLARRTARGRPWHPENVRRTKPK